MTSTPKPHLPELAALQNDDSILTRRFGKEVVNYYAGSFLNRYSFLRDDSLFLRNAAASPSARYIALENLNPLVADKTELAYLSFEDVEPLIGSEPFRFGLGNESIKMYDSTKTDLLVMFLGLLQGSEYDHVINVSADHGDVKGVPYFAVDISPKGDSAEAAQIVLQAQIKKGHSIQENTRAMSLHAEAAALYAQARSIFDWHYRNPFCAGCGQPTLSVHAGYQRFCPPTDLKGGSEPQPRGECPTRHGVSNVCFPRSDPTMIAAVVSADGQRILLGRQSRWPPHFYSTLAGFLEPGESIEEAVRREVWEESGVRVGRVVIHSSQPWPYPASLMIGAIAQALPGEGEQISLNDRELEDAKWVTIDEARKALQTGVGSLGGPPPPGYKQGDMRMPPSQAIANRLVTAVVEGFLTATPRI